MTNFNQKIKDRDALRIRAQENSLSVEGQRQLVALNREIEECDVPHIGKIFTSLNMSEEWVLEQFKKTNNLSHV